MTIAKPLYQNRVRVLRAAGRLSQLDLEARSGLKRYRISLIERGQRRATEYERSAIAGALGVSVDAVFPEFSSMAASGRFLASTEARVG